MITADGWRVIAVELNGIPVYRVTQLGYLTGGTAEFTGRGVIHTLAEVRRLLGDSFELLVDEPVDST